MYSTFPRDSTRAKEDGRGGGKGPHKRNVVSLRDDLISNVTVKISNFFVVEISSRVAPEDLQSTLS